MVAGEATYIQPEVADVTIAAWSRIRARFLGHIKVVTEVPPTEELVEQIA